MAGLLGVFLMAMGPCFAAEKPKPAFAVIAGSVFRDPGFAFPGASVILQPDPDPKTSVKVKVKIKTMKTVADTRGEFSFRVPAVPMRYTLTIQATGFSSETKTISIGGEERQEVFVTLKPVKEGSQ